MFVSKGQIFSFIACIAFGAVCGVFFSFSYLLKRKFDNYPFRVLSDFFAFVFTSVLFVFFSYKIFLGEFRIYMTIGVVSGIALYLKSFNLILAKTLDKIYNIKHRRKKGKNYDRFKN